MLETHLPLDSHCGVEQIRRIGNSGRIESRLRIGSRRHETKFSKKLGFEIDLGSRLVSFLVGSADLAAL